MTTFNETILEAEFEGIKFPVASADTDTGHDFAAHAAYRIPGDDVEWLGRKSDKGTLVVPLHSGVTGAGPDLYPGRYWRLLNKIKRSPMGRLVHPVRGPMTALLHSWHESFHGDERSGVTLQIGWIEHNATAALQRPIRLLAQVAGTPEAVSQRAVDFDGYLLTFLNYARVPDPPAEIASLINSSLSLLAVGALTTSAVKAEIDYMSEETVARMLYAPLRSAAGYPVMASLIDLWASIFALQDSLLATAQEQSFVTSTPMSIVDLSLMVYGDATRTGDIYASNTITNPVLIPAGTKIMVPTRSL